MSDPALMMLCNETNGDDAPGLIECISSLYTPSKMQDKFKKKEECETAQLIPEVEKVISLEQVKKGDFTDSTETTWTIGNEVSAAEIEEFDVQANCPTTVHVIDALLLPEIDLPETPVDVKEVIAVAQGAPAPEITGPTLDLEIPDEDVIELPSYVG